MTRLLAAHCAVPIHLDWTLLSAGAAGAYLDVCERHVEHLAAAGARRERAACLETIGLHAPTLPPPSRRSRASVSRAGSPLGHCWQRPAPAAASAAPLGPATCCQAAMAADRRRAAVAFASPSCGSPRVIRPKPRLCWRRSSWPPPAATRPAAPAVVRPHPPVLRPHGRRDSRSQPVAEGFPGHAASGSARLDLATHHLDAGRFEVAVAAFAHVRPGPLQRCSKLYRWDEALRVARRIQTGYPDHARVTDVQLEIGYIREETGSAGRPSPSSRSAWGGPRVRTPPKRASASARPTRTGATTARRSRPSTRSVTTAPMPAPAGSTRPTFSGPPATRSSGRATRRAASTSASSGARAPTATTGRLSQRHRPVAPRGGGR